MAGFMVLGVDNKPQKRYCGDGFICMDALEFLRQETVESMARFSLVWASPPCQRYSPGAAQHGTQERHPDLIAPIRKELWRLKASYILENIPSAKRKLLTPALLCGHMFSLPLYRHRLFETSDPVCPPAHPKHHPLWKDSPFGRVVTITSNSGGSSRRRGYRMASLGEARKALELDWLSQVELREAIPPRYARFLAQEWKKSRKEEAARKEKRKNEDHQPACYEGV